MPEYNSYSVSPVRRRNPMGMNVTAFADAVSKLDAKYQQTAQQQSAIDMALAQLPVNAAEDEWRYNLGNDIRNQIEAVENPNDKYLISVKAAGQLLSRPDVIGRIRAQADYDNFVKQTQARNDIDQRTKNWALENNQYTYQDVKDKYGNIVGGTEWKPNITPVSQVDLSKLGSLALQWAKPDGAKGSQATFIDSEGNFTNDVNSAVDLAYQTTSGWTKLGKDKLMQAINAAIDMTPGARASINQDYDVAVWDYNKLTPEQKLNLGESEVTDSNGRILTKQEFLARKLNPWANAASYSQTESTTNYGTGLQTRLGLKQQAAANAMADITGGGINYTGNGYNITYNTSDYIADANGNIKDAIDKIAGAMPALANTKQWKEAVATNNYEGIEQIVRSAVTKNGKNYFSSTSEKAQKIVNDALRDINNNQSFVSDLFKDVDKDTKDALLFKFAIDAGQSLPENNQFAKAFYKFLGDISDGKPAEQYKITFNDRNDVEDFLNSLGMSESTAKSNGIVFGKDNDLPTVTIKQNAKILPKAIINFFNGDDDEFIAHSKVTALNSDGQDIGSSKRGNFLSKIGDRMFGGWTDSTHFNKLYDNVNYIYTKFNEIDGNMRTTDQLKTADIPAIANARRDYGIESAEFKRVKDDIIESLRTRLSGSDWHQYQVYGYDEDTGGLTIMPNEDKTDKMSNIIGHLQADAANIQFATNGIQSGYYITLHEKRDKNGNVDPNSDVKTYFIASGVEDEALQEFKTDSKTRAMGEYNRRRSVTGRYRTYLGDDITDISNEGALFNGVPVASDYARKQIELDKIIDDEVMACQNIPRYEGEEEEKKRKAYIDAKIESDVEIIAKYFGRPNDGNYKALISNIIYSKL